MHVDSLSRWVHKSATTASHDGNFETFTADSVCFLHHLRVKTGIDITPLMQQ